MSSNRWRFTSESVTEGHPDKMADQISDSILDAILAEDPTGRVACETLLTTGLVVVAGEITTTAYVEIPKIAREAICAIGTDRARRIGATLLARPADEPLWEAIAGAMLAHYEGAAQAPDTEWMARLKLVLAAPAIRGEYLKINSEMQEALAEHRVEHAALHRLQAIAGVGQGARDDDRHRVFDVGRLHDVGDVGGGELFVGGVHGLK